MFNLDPPPGFRGLDPDLPVACYQRHLPHWRQQGATYFVTFRLADSIPQQQLNSLKRWREIWEKSHPEPRSEADWHEFAREITLRTEVWMDEGYGECHFRRPELAKLAADALLHFQDSRSLTGCFVVMPNHIHWVVRPLNGYDLEGITGSVKGFIGRQLNSLLQRSGVCGHRKVTTESFEMLNTFIVWCSTLAATRRKPG